MICALHQNPLLDIGLGVSKRTFYTLKGFAEFFNDEVYLYVLSQKNFSYSMNNNIIQKGIKKPSILKNITGGYCTLFPQLLARCLKNSELLRIKPRIVIYELPYMGFITLKTIRFPSYEALRIYNAHNFEYNFVKVFIGGKFLKTFVLKKIKEIEETIVKNSDFIFSTCKEEKESFVEFYGVDPSKVIVVPNGCDTCKITPAEENIKQKIKRDFGFSYNTQIALFLGSNIPFNVESAKFIVGNLAPKLPKLSFAICGKVCISLNKTNLPKNVQLLGVLPEDIKNLLLQGCDIALNPIIRGAGTNVKMLEYFAAGLPVITTQIGARGLSIKNWRNAIICDLEDFQKNIIRLIEDDDLRIKLSKNARKIAEDYDWKNILYNACNELKKISGDLQ